MGRTKAVLIVDDEDLICEYTKNILERRAWETFSATSGEKGLEIFKRERPCACIIDIHMPYSEMDGVELFKQIRGIDSRCKCIMVTREDDERLQKELCNLGLHAYYVKPLGLEEMRRLIEQLEQD